MKNGLRWLIKKASRDTSSGNFIPEIDGLRFIAIFSVILYHISGYITVKTSRLGEHDPLATFLSHGDFGVQLFFAISGFVIAIPFAKAHLLGGKRPPLKQFYFRRITRLEPPYFLNLIGCYILIILATGKAASDLLPHLIASMGYVHNIAYAAGSSINPVAWSLEIEIQFYILAPLLTTVFMVRSKLYRRGLLVTIIAALSIMQLLYPISELSVLSAGQYFLTGFLLVDVYLTDWKQKPTKKPIWDLVSIFAWGAICILLFHEENGKLFIVIPIFIAYYAAFKGTLSNKFFSLPIIYTIGGMCYTTYLYHYIVISAFGRLIYQQEIVIKSPLWVSIIISSFILIPIILILCAFLFVFTEKPFMNKDWYVKLSSLLFIKKYKSFIKIKGNN